MDKRRVAVRAVIIDDGALFCVRQLHYDNGVATPVTYWCTPGGGVDIGEPLLAALHREMIEETGVAPVIGDLLFVQQFRNKDTEHLEFFFKVTNVTDYKTIDLSATSHGQAEIAEYGFVRPNDQMLPTFLRTDLPNDDTVVAPRFYEYELTDNYICDGSGGGRHERTP